MEEHLSESVFQFELIFFVEGPQLPNLAHINQNRALVDDIIYFLRNIREIFITDF
jgi:hypothetical protein